MEGEGGILAEDFDGLGDGEEQFGFVGGFVGEVVGSLVLGVVSGALGEA